MPRYLILVCALFCINQPLHAWAQDTTLAINIRNILPLNAKPEVISPITFPNPSINNSLGQTFHVIAPGKFLMGASENDPETQSDENQVEVEISNRYYIAATEVTQSHWFRIMKSKPWLDFPESLEGFNLPATGMTWFEAVAFCDKLSALERKHYRLPTEAEWEYACRTGQQQNSIDLMVTLERTAWFRETGRSKSDCCLHVVGRKQVNALQLADMQGNAWEWCSDWYYERLFSGVNVIGPTEGKAKVFRGGSAQSAASECRPTYREAAEPGFTSPMLGFRVVLEVD